MNGRYLGHLEHWPSNALTLGSYTCYLPGQFTTVAGNEGKPIGNLHFAGERQCPPLTRLVAIHIVLFRGT